MRKSICILQNRIVDQHSGGYEIQIYNIAQALLTKEWEVFYICEGSGFREYILDRIKVFQLPIKYYFSYYNPSVWNLLKKIKPAVIYQRSRNPYSCGIIGARFSRKKQSQFVFGLGSSDDMISFFLTKALYHDKKVNPLKKVLLLPDAILKDFLFEKNFKMASYIISQNHSQQNICLTKFNRQSQILRSIHPTVKHEIIKANPPAICWIANARAVKQPELFALLVKQLADLKQNHPIQFIMVLGKNIGKFSNTCLMNTLQTFQNVKILGELSIDEANDVMEKSSILVNTSVYEGFSNTFIQAWLRETPVVSLNSDPDDILKRNQIGFHSKNMEQLLNDVRFLINNETERIAMGKRARAYAEEHHNFYRVAEQLDALFTKLIQ